MTTKTPKATKAAATPKPKRISKPKADKITKQKKTPREPQLAAMLGRVTLLSGLIWWTRSMTLILLVFETFERVGTRSGDQCHATPQ